MPKTDGYLTKERILNVAEKLFSELGYDAASIGQIAKSAEINKATIYYHFKDKNHILHSLFVDMIKQMHNRLIPFEESNFDLKVKLEKELHFLREKRNLISILLMESMKAGSKDDSLFKIAYTEIYNEKKQLSEFVNSKEKKELYFVHEFFTGFIPILNFIVFEEKYSEFFQIKKEKIMEYFIEAIIRSHYNTHIE